MENQFRLRLTKTSTLARTFGVVANLALFLGFGWLIMNRQVSTGRLMAIMIPAAVVVYLLGRLWLTYDALVTVEANRLLVQPLKRQAATVISFSEVESFSLEKTRKTELLSFKLTDGTTRELDGIMSADDTFADFVRAMEQAAAQYQARHPAFMARGAGFAAA
ncbi:hypothetical protein [Hymenobacter terrenus]|uniref:hypothetical protein n=1 Tax=Hymenobacter terrenus TaxID=1629124 RepID=UPI000619FA2A|nr:hypothetical protein [Hymenobacter terrenus]